MAQVATKRESMDVTASAGGSGPVVSARILKKRETDRKCQRMIRERTKSRIAYLEGLVEQFREQDSSGRLETMMKQLSDMKDERDALVKKVKTIESIISDGKLKEETEIPETSVIKVRSDSEDEIPASIDSHHTVFESPSPHNSDPASSSQDISTYVLHNKQFAAHLQNSNATAWSSACAQTLPPQPCECSNQPAMIGPANGMNRWRYANDTLTEWFKWSPQALDMRNYSASNDDVPIRAVVEGWDSVEQQGHVHPIWRLLRGIDENIFGSLGQRERLATLQLMGWLILAHVNPTREQHMKLPSFYLKRATQDMLNAYATEFFAWPGLRERFVYSEHRYCSSIFWRLYCQNIHVQWPYEFRDCYIHNTETGLYNISPTFHKRISDIRAWTMGLDMFKQYPELYSDIPAWNHIPAPLNPTSPLNKVRKALPAASKTPVVTNKGKTPERRSSNVPSAQQISAMQVTPPREQNIIQFTQVYNNYQPSNHTSGDTSAATISPSYEYPPTNVATSMANMQGVTPMAAWGYNGGLDMFHAGQA